MPFASSPRGLVGLSIRVNKLLGLRMGGAGGDKNLWVATVHINNEQYTKIEEKERENRDLTWFGNMPMSTGENERFCYLK